MLHQSNLLDGMTSGHSQTISTQTCSSLQTVFPQSVLAGHGEFTLVEPSLQMQRYTVSVASRQIPGPQSTPSHAANNNKDLYMLFPHTEMEMMKRRFSFYFVLFWPNLPYIISLATSLSF